MFGYVNIYKDELKVKDYKLWQSYYCGLCEALGKRYNQLIKLGLNYDMTFLAIVIGGIISENPEIKKKFCLLHPINKRYKAKSPIALDYACDVSVVLTSEKLSDDINDDKKLSAFFLRIPYNLPFKKAKKHICADKIKSHLSDLYKLEKENCRNIDKVADCFALLMADIMTPSFIPEEKRENLYKFGYNLGRWIYIIDALNDYEDDKKKNKYNPFEELNIEDVEFTLTYTLSQIGNIYKELDFKMNKALIENIIFLGLRLKQDQILKKVTGEKKNESI